MKAWTPKEVRELRKRYKLSKAKLGELIGVSKNYIYYLEKGERTPSKTVQIVLGFVEKQLQENEKGKGGKNHGRAKGKKRPSKRDL